jgi:ABC-type multidrug transport system ATPase subunit/pSer/pThr/pTyr-binding forkhead associated (FHA) protein
MNNSFNTCAQLVIVESNGLFNSYALDRDQFTIGRIGGANDIFINSKIVSSQHGMITYIDGAYVYNDLASTNGTNINGQLVRGVNNMPSPPVRLYDGCVLSIGANNGERVYMLFSCGTRNNMAWNIIPLSHSSEITIGRGTDNNIVIPNITVSRKQAVIRCSNGTVSIVDTNSSNGTLVNGNIIRGKAPFNDSDVVKLGNSIVARVGNYILYGVPGASQSNDIVSYQSNIESKSLSVKNPENYEYARQGGVQVEVQNISRLVKCKNGTGINGSNKKYILSGVSLTINPGELVAVLGGSGAGKTTFMNCINGFEPATEGRVLINGTDLYKNYQTVKASIGYVPQQDIVHDDLTLEDMLTYTGKLRLPKDVTKQEMSQRVAEVLDMVDLTAQKDTFIKKLSGGQRKRASIAVELISDPTLFFLDEPTSGLDPEAETNLMHQLKGLSEKKGKTVIVITHTLQNIRLFDKVIFLAPGGKLCFYGTPKEAEKFFGVDNLVDAYEKIVSDIDGWVNKYNSNSGKGVM